ncbi:MAG TPA: hypothetical protein VM580_04935 [Labilithrix sp.]|nr:hypothetical protein [Labilithrix sp.]
MITDEPREPSSTEGALEDVDRLEVLVEDLFIEDYGDAALAEPAGDERSRFSKVVRPIRAKAKPLLGGLLALGGLLLVGFAMAGRRRKGSRFLRFFHLLGVAH